MSSKKSTAKPKKTTPKLNPDKALKNYKLPLTLIDDMSKVAAMEFRSVTGLITNVMTEYCKSKLDKSNS